MVDVFWNRCLSNEKFNVRHLNYKGAASTWGILHIPEGPGLSFGWSWDLAWETKDSGNCFYWCRLWVQGCKVAVMATPPRKRQENIHPENTFSDPLGSGTFHPGSSAWTRHSPCLNGVSFLWVGQFSNILCLHSLQTVPTTCALSPLFIEKLDPFPGPWQVDWPCDAALDQGK